MLQGSPSIDCRVLATSALVATFASPLVHLPITPWSLFSLSPKIGPRTTEPTVEVERSGLLAQDAAPVETISGIGGERYARGETNPSRGAAEWKRVRSQ